MSIYYFLIEAVPEKDNPESEYLGGAFINCWIKADSTREAIKKAKSHIKDEKWKWLYAEDMYTVERVAYVDKPEWLEYYESACKCGLGSVFHTWPIDEE